jgi:hypothetical protein
LVIAVFLLHHIPEDALATFTSRIRSLLARGGRFYSLDPTVHRFSGRIGRLLVPSLMQRYHTQDERELDPQKVRRLFSESGFDVRVSMYDFISTPLAGLFPSWSFGYRLARNVDTILLWPSFTRRLGSNFELIATKN